MVWTCPSIARASLQLLMQSDELCLVLLIPEYGVRDENNRKGWSQGHSVLRISNSFFKTRLQTG